MADPQTVVPSLLSFAVVGAIVTTAGTLFGHYLKEAVLAKSFESWKKRQALETLYGKYRDPIVLSAIELAMRLNEACNEHPAKFLAGKVLSCTSPEPSHSSVRDPYYFRYKFQSTIYRFAAFLGWLELYRQDLVFLDARESKKNTALQKLLNEIREDFAEGRLNSAKDWDCWSDALIFREDQRAVGEAMITSVNGIRTVMGYGAFVAMLEDATSLGNRWLRVVTNFLIDPGKEKDFRLVRYQRLIIHLIDLVKTLDQRRLPEALKVATERYVKEESSRTESFKKLA
jgi:hypothetical protein